MKIVRKPAYCGEGISRGSSMIVVTPWSLCLTVTSQWSVIIGEKVQRMSYAALDAGRVAKAAELALQTLAAEKETSDVHQRKTILIERIHALAKAAAETAGQGTVTLTSEEFWLISKNW